MCLFLANVGPDYKWTSGEVRNYLLSFVKMVATFSKIKIYYVDMTVLKLQFKKQENLKKPMENNSQRYLKKESKDEALYSMASLLSRNRTGPL